MLKFIERVGFFRLTLIPVGILILISAYHHRILGMGIIGAIMLIFGFFNRCLLSGRCDINEPDKEDEKRA